MSLSDTIARGRQCLVDFRNGDTNIMSSEILVAYNKRTKQSGLPNFDTGGVSHAATILEKGVDISELPCS
jgi:hypothetical protein